MKVYKLMIQTFCIFDKNLINTNNLYSTNITKTMNLPRGFILRDWSLLMPGTGAEGIWMGHENF